MWCISTVEIYAVIDSNGQCCQLHLWCCVSAVIGSYRACSSLARFTWVRYCVYYILLLCLSGVHQGGTVHYLRYSIITSHIYFSVHYTGSYTGNDAVLAMLFPIRVDTSCGDLYVVRLFYASWSLCLSRGLHQSGTPISTSYSYTSIHLHQQLVRLGSIHLQAISNLIFNYVSRQVSLHLHVLQYALARYIMCVMMGGAWSMAA